VRCSLLTLSTYLDRELPADRAAEVDAHLIGCTRCQTGLGYLREEWQRVRTLSQVTVSEDSAHAILSAVGLLSEDEPLPGERRFQEPEPPVRDVPPWAQMRGDAGRTLPWSPRPPARASSIPPAPPAHAIPAPPPLPEQSAPPLDDPYTLTMAFDTVSASVADPDTEPSLPLDTAGVIETGVTAPQDEEIEVPGTAQTPPTPSIEEPAPEYIDSDDDWDLDDVVPPAGVEHELSNAEPVVDELSDAEPVVEPLVAAAAYDEPEPEPEPAPVQPVVQHDVPQPPPLQPPAMGPALGAPRPAGFVARMRDAVMVRLALMRGEPKLDPDVQIVSGAGAPARGTYPAGPLTNLPHHPANLRTAASVADVEALHDVVAPPEIEPAHDVESPDIEPLHDVESPHDSAPAYDIESFDDVEPSHDIDLDDDVLPAPPQPRRSGRHTRALQQSLGTRPSWLSLEPLRQLGRAISESRAPAVGVAGRDSRLWLFGAVVLLVLLVGVLIGKQTTTLPIAGTATKAPATIPGGNPAAPTPAVNPSGLASPAAQPPAATPAPAVITLPTLSSAKTFGSGATQFITADVRYGAHTGDYRLVFDLQNTTGGAGTPKVTMGFADNGSQLYVEFTNVSASGQPVQPDRGGTVTGAELESNTPPGITVYRFTLSRTATLSAYYLANPVRLVIDLTY
jgi:Putative zinc-finger